MAATAIALCDFYTATKTIFDDTDQIYTLNHELYSKPYPPETQQKLSSNEAELAKRAELASNFSDLAASFTALTKSTASTDTGASAAKLGTAAAALASVTASSGEQTALKIAVQMLVTALQERKEREAAKAMDAAVKALRDLFDKEQDIWNDRELLYSGIASNLATSLVDASATDNTAVLKIALDPFGLAPSSVPSSLPPDMSARLAVLAKAQIQTRKSAMDASFQKASSDMSKSLHTMSTRVDAVANEKPMDLRTTPLTVASVEEWASQYIPK